MIIPKARAAMPPVDVEHDKVLLVEGDTPAHFFEAMLRDLGIENTIEIWNYGGNKDLRKYLKSLAVTSGFKQYVRSLGIIIDAEEDVSATKDAVDSAIKNASLESHVTPQVYILPDNKSPGMIETLCVRSVQSEPCFECVNQFFQCLPTKCITLPTGIHGDKHLAHVYLVAKNYPQMFPGIAAHKGAWPFASTIFDDLKTFLKGL